MKTIIYISFFIVILFSSLTGCEEMKIGDAALSAPPSVSVTVDTIFSKIEYAERFLFGGYETLPYGLNTKNDDKLDKMGGDILEAITDLNHSYLQTGGANKLYYSGQYTSGSEDGGDTKFGFIKDGAWEGIRIGWIFIENADKIPDSTPEYIAQLKAEARVLIALHYTDMFRNFGGLPWINKAYGIDDEIDCPRLTAKATMDSIIHQLDLAAPDLPWVVENLSNMDGRFTKASALGLKARLLLFCASPLFNDDMPYMDGEAAQQHFVWFGHKDPDLWQRAADAAIYLIDEIEQGGYYALVNTGNPRQDFQDAYYKRGNGEILISTRIQFKAPTKIKDNNFMFYQNAAEYGSACPTQEYVDMFGMANGLPITDPNSGFDPANPLANRDPRLYETVLVNGDTYQGRIAELWIGGRERPNQNFDGTRSGYGLRKFLLERDKATSLGSIIQWPYLRLAEIYLSAAEALNEVHGGPTPQAYQYVNIVRARVGLGGLQENLTQEEFREAVLQERSKEFGYEEVRWFDLIRWKRESDFTKTLHGKDLFLNDDGTLEEQITVLPPRIWQTNWSPKWYLSAFPQSEVYKEYGLMQNPGWE
jgi:hypothetical protein